MWPKKLHCFAVKWSALINHKRAVSTYPTHTRQQIQSQLASGEGLLESAGIFLLLYKLFWEKKYVVMASPSPESFQLERLACKEVLEAAANLSSGKDLN